jgi:hypothetical protein
MVKATSSKKEVSRDQGDQIGRIFAFWAIIFFAQGF